MKANRKNGTASRDFDAALRRLKEEGRTDKKSLALLCASDARLPEIFEAASRARRERFGNVVHLRALIEFSNICRCRCGYCGLNAGNRTLERYRMEPDEILRAARDAVDAGFRTVVLQSGEDFGFSAKDMALVVRGIKDMGDVAVTLSMGERTREELKLFRDAGADRYLMKHETALPDVYAALHPGSGLEKRLRHYDLLHELGYQVGGGFMVGLPPWSPEILAENLLLLRECRVGMAGIGPFLPCPGTALENAAPGSALETLKAVALARLLLPDAMLPATTALEASAEGRGIDALEYGANVVMPQATPARYRNLYRIYPKPVNVGETAAIRKKIVDLLERSGFAVAADRGDCVTETETRR